MTPVSAFVNRILTGDSTFILPQLPAESIDFVLTDPPYLVNYRDRRNRTVPNDDNTAWLRPAFAQISRVLKNDRFCISFYGWNKADLFLKVAEFFRPKLQRVQTTPEREVKIIPPLIVENGKAKVPDNWPGPVIILPNVPEE